MQDTTQHNERKRPGTARKQTRFDMSIVDLQEMLAFVGIEVSEKTIGSWSKEQRDQAEDLAVNLPLQVQINR